MTSEKENPCISCGLCCIYYPTMAKNNGHIGEWADIRGCELDEVPRKLYKITRNPPKLELFRQENINKFIKDKQDPIWKGFRRCVALEGTQTQEVKCSVYENRPIVCKVFEPGSDRCNKIREWGGLDVL